RYVLERIPLVVDGEALAERSEALFHAGELGVDDLEGGLLLRPVRDELAADLLDVRVIGPLVPVVAEGVGGAVHAQEALAAADGVIEGLLAVRRHRRA